MYVCVCVCVTNLQVRRYVVPPNGIDRFEEKAVSRRGRYKNREKEKKKGPPGVENGGHLSFMTGKYINTPTLSFPLLFYDNTEEDSHSYS